MKNIHRIISKSERRMFARKRRQINRIYNAYFSNLRFRILDVLSKIRIVLGIFGEAFLIYILHFIITLVMAFFFENSDNAYLQNTSYTLTSISIGVFVGVVIAAMFSLGATNEFFNKTELSLFNNILLTKFVDNQLIAVYICLDSFGSLIMSLCHQYLFSITVAIISLGWAVILMFRAVIYFRKNRYERFGYYLVHSHLYEKSSIKARLYDYISMLELINNEGEYEFEQLYKLIAKRSHHIDIYLSELQTKIDRDESIAFEQNALEDFYIQFSNRIVTPIQLFSMVLFIGYYLDLLAKSNQSQIKDIKKTRSNMIKCLNSALHSKAMAFANISIKIDDMPVYSLLIDSFRDLIFTKMVKIIAMQKAIVGLFKRFTDILITHDAFSELEELDILKEREIVSKANEVSDENFESISILANKMEAALSGILSSAKLSQ